MLRQGATESNLTFCKVMIRTGSVLDQGWVDKIIGVYNIVISSLINTTLVVSALCIVGQVTHAAVQKIKPVASPWSI